MGRLCGSTVPSRAEPKLRFSAPPLPSCRCWTSELPTTATYLETTNMFEQNLWNHKHVCFFLKTQAFVRYVQHCDFLPAFLLSCSHDGRLRGVGSNNSNSQISSTKHPPLSLTIMEWRTSFCIYIYMYTHIMPYMMMYPYHSISTCKLWAMKAMYGSHLCSCLQDNDVTANRESLSGHDVDALMAQCPCCCSWCCGCCGSFIIRFVVVT